MSFTVRWNTPVHWSEKVVETRREHYERFGQPVPEPPEVEEHYAHILDWFWDMSAARQSGFNGPNPLSLTDIANWSVLTGNLIAADEVAVIRAMDAAFLAQAAREQHESSERSKPPEK